MMELVLPFISSYLLGSISFAYIAGRMKGLDLRREGSGKLGARNVKRVVGRGAAFAVLLLDLMKGGGAVFLATLISENEHAAMTGWLGVICGHGWPLFLRFKGGKGLASSAGALLIISPTVLAAELAIGAALIAIKREVYLTATIMVILLPLLAYLAGSPEMFPLSIPVAAVILILHRQNIVDMLKKG